MLTGFTVQNGGFIGNVSQSTTTSSPRIEPGLKSTSQEETDEDEISPEMLRQLGLTSFVKQKPALPTPSISDSFTSANTIADTPMNTILLLRSNSRSSWGHGILQRSPSTSPSFLSTQQQGSAPPSSAGSVDPFLDINLVEKNGSRMNRVKKGNWKPSVWIKEEEEV